jgi:SAM-dependent methyltransferase
MASCPLCAGGAAPFAPGTARGALRCGTCALTFVPDAAHLSREAEKARYAEHDNRPDDPGYREFLDRLLKPLTERLRPGAEGLDFGCGPGPTASVMMRERGFAMTDYDPYFRPDEAALGRTYDFIVSTEVFEHLRRPAETLGLLDRLLRPDGLLAVMTTFLADDDGFATWWYAKDPTHIAFYKEETLRWLAGSKGWELELLPRGAALLRKPAAGR